MPGGWFVLDAKLNFAENLLRRTDDSDALVFRAEDKIAQRMSCPLGTVKTWVHRARISLIDQLRQRDVLPEQHDLCEAVK